LNAVVPSATSVVRIVERLAHEWPRGVTVATLVDELAMNRSTCFNVVSTLSQAGWVARLDRHGGWTLGPKIFEIGSLHENERFADVQTELASLAEQLKLVVFLAEKSRSGAYVVIARADRGRGVRVTVEVGNRFPYGAPALMACFEAWTPAEVLERLVREHPLPRFTETSVTTLAGLKETLAQVRARGFAYSVRRFVQSQSGVAAPVIDSRGHVIYVLCTLGFSTVLDDRNVMEVGARLRDSAATISRYLGGGEPRTGVSV
jgi:DNA-binding IclR family transcriptional regulator